MLLNLEEAGGLLIVSTLPFWRTNGEMETPVATNSPPKNPGVSAVLSFFFTGLGQIYNGQLAKGLTFIAIAVLNVLLAFVLIGFLTGPVFWIYGMYDAYRNAERFNRGEVLDWGA